MVWPRQKDARGENTKINYGLAATGEKDKGMSKKNVDGRSTSSHDNKKFRIRSMEKQRGMAFGFRNTATVVKNPDRWIDGIKQRIWHFRWYMFEVLWIYVRSSKYFWQHNCTSTPKWCYSVMCATYTVLWRRRWTEALFARLAKTLTATERGKQSSMFTSVSPSCCSLLKPEMVQDDDAIVREDQRVTTRQFLRSLSANKGSVIHIVRDLWYSNVRVRWISRSVYRRHTKPREKPFLELVGMFWG